MLLLLLRMGFCQEQAVIPQPNGTNVHIATCAVVEPRDLTEEETRKLTEKPPLSG